MTSSRRSKLSAFVLLGAASGLLLAMPGCTRKHVPATSVEELGYPTCPASSGEPKPAVLVASGDLRSGTNDVRSTIVERFRIERRDCHLVASIRQEWPHQIADVEAVFDLDGLPIRAWRRWTNPLSKRPDGNADFKRFDFRTPVISAKHRADTGVVDFEHIHGPRPKALIGSGHGLLTVWIQRAKLEVGQKVREPAFDFRGIEVAKDVTLMRHPDKDEPTLGRKVRVYTIYGRESVFTDEHDVVIGDLAGLVPFDKSPLPTPRSMPSFEPADPVGTP